MQEQVKALTDNLQSTYDEQYSDKMTEWRELGGKYKAQNILSVCNNYKFVKVLECGAGEGSILKFLDQSNAFPELHAIEISDSGIAQIKARKLAKLKEVKKFNGYEIPYADKSFDMVYCSHVMEHVEHPRLLLRELKRVSKFQVFEVPLDYAIGIDCQVDHLLSYGHINVYTPSLFKFLLKSEGYEILEETLTHMTEDVVRFSWYQNMKMKNSIVKNFMLKLLPLRRILRRIRSGQDWYYEYAFSAYTCLTKSKGDLKISAVEMR